MNINSTNSQKIAIYCETCVCKSCDKYKTILEEIREVLKGKIDGDIDEMIDKINEALR